MKEQIYKLSQMLTELELEIDWNVKNRVPGSVGKLKRIVKYMGESLGAMRRIEADRDTKGLIHDPHIEIVDGVVTVKSFVMLTPEESEAQEGVLDLIDTEVPNYARWIPVSERLPNHEKDTWSKKVIALSDNFQVFKLDYQHGIWQRSRAFIDSGGRNIIAWIEFPDDCDL